MLSDLAFGSLSQQSPQFYNIHLPSAEWENSMAFGMNLWKVNANNLEELSKTRLDSENRLEDWIANDPSILGMELLIIGRQIQTSFGGRIDLLALDRQGNLAILELKRDKTPREIVAQILDYASWVKSLTENDISSIAGNYLNDSLDAAFSSTFDDDPPDNLNTNHSMIIVASELDESSERIVQYLANEYKVGINVIFFTFFKVDSQEFLGRAWLMDPKEVEEKSESRKKSMHDAMQAYASRGGITARALFRRLVLEEGLTNEEIEAHPEIRDFYSKKYPGYDEQKLQAFIKERVKTQCYAIRKYLQSGE
jgi:hypothetical protein